MMIRGQTFTVKKLNQDFQSQLHSPLKIPFGAIWHANPCISQNTTVLCGSHEKVCPSSIFHPVNKYVLAFPANSMTINPWQFNGKANSRHLNVLSNSNGKVGKHKCKQMQIMTVCKVFGKNANISIYTYHFRHALLTICNLSEGSWSFAFGMNSRNMEPTGTHLYESICTSNTKAHSFLLLNSKNVTSAIKVFN